MTRVVVLGAGVGGLAAAARLAAAGHAVTVCEATSTVGGKLATYERQTTIGSFRYELGPTLLTLPQVFAELFAATGDPLESTLALRPLDTIARYRFADGTEVDTVRDLDNQRELMDGALGGGTGQAWLRVIERGAQIWRAVEEPVFGTELSLRTVPRLLARMRRLDDLRAVAPGRTLRGVTRTMLSDARQQLMLERYGTYEGSDPRRATAALAVVPYLEHTFGAWYIDGGLHLLAQALADRVHDRGGRVRTNTPVTQVDVAGGAVGGVVLADGTRLPADVVVCNADARVLYGALLSGRRRRVPPADSLSGFVMLLGLRGATAGLAEHTVFFGASAYDDEFDAIFGRRPIPVPDPVVYAHAPADVTSAPPGHEALYLLVNAPRHAPGGGRAALDWTAARLADDYADQVLGRLAARGCDVRDRVVFREVRTPADLERSTLAPGGAIYGRVQHGALSTLRRPANRSRVRGLFLVGGSTHPGGGLPLVAMSARIVADAVGDG